MSRFDYVKYDEESIKIQEAAKVAAQELEHVIEHSLVDGRAKSLAHTKLEECYMWIGKAIRDGQVSNRGAEPQEERKNG